jgi:hypothetical protein
MKNTLLFSAGLAFTILFSACNKDDGRYDPNNGNDNITFAYQIKAVNTSGTSNQKSTAGTITWTSGFANPTLIKFEAKQDNSKLEYTAVNNGQVDLFAFDPMPFGNFTLGPGTYKEIELKMLFKRNGDLPAVELNGMYTGTTLSIPVRLIIEGPLEIKTEQEDVVITDGVSYIAITDMDLAYYTSTVTESMWMNADLTNGVLVISEDSNEDIYDRILDKIRGKKHKCHFRHD